MLADSFRHDTNPAPFASFISLELSRQPSSLHRLTKVLCVANIRPDFLNEWRPLRFCKARCPMPLGCASCS
jgi:hypothetical protein